MHVHIVPHDDEREHSLDDDCWCDPDFSLTEGVYTHHAADLREVYEEVTGEGLKGRLWLVLTEDT